MVIEHGRAPSDASISIYVEVMPFKLVNQIYLFQNERDGIKIMMQQGYQSLEMDKIIMNNLEWAGQRYRQ